jgi:hypothetical protein
MQVQAYHLPLRRQVSERARVAAMHTRRGLSTARTGGAYLRRMKYQRQPLIFLEDPFKSEMCGKSEHDGSRYRSPSRWEQDVDDCYE